MIAESQERYMFTFIRNHQSIFQSVQIILTPTETKNHSSSYTPMLVFVIKSSTFHAPCCGCETVSALVISLIAETKDERNLRKERFL